MLRSLGLIQATTHNGDPEFLLVLVVYLLSCLNIFSIFMRQNSSWNIYLQILNDII